MFHASVLILIVIPFLEVCDLTLGPCCILFHMYPCSRHCVPHSIPSLHPQIALEVDESDPNVSCDQTANTCNVAPGFALVFLSDAAVGLTSTEDEDVVCDDSSN